MVCFLLVRCAALWSRGERVWRRRADAAAAGWRWWSLCAHRPGRLRTAKGVGGCSSSRGEVVVVDPCHYGRESVADDVAGSNNGCGIDTQCLLPSVTARRRRIASAGARRGRVRFLRRTQRPTR